MIVTLFGKQKVGESSYSFKRSKARKGRPCQSYRKKLDQVYMVYADIKRWENSSSKVKCNDFLNSETIEEEW